MAEPDFTNPELSADAIKREPSPIAGPSCAPVEQPPPIKDEVPDGDFDEFDEDGYSSLEGEPTVEPMAPSIPVEQLPKPDSMTRLRYMPYTVQDLSAGAVDGRCPQDWPLAHLWPVYVGNFRCADAAQCSSAIRHYFASKGLLVRWFFQLKDDYYFQFQKKANLYDGLVYFGSEQDAVQALGADHSIHNGYTLNVFPGRDPVFFPPDRSAMFRNIRSGYVYSEEFFARALMARHGGVRCVVKFDIKNGAAEFYSVAQTQGVFSKERQFQPSLVGHQALQKQRYVEANIQEQILNGLGAQPNALLMTENDPIYRKMQSAELPEPLRCPGPPPRRHGGGDGSIQPVRRGPSKYSQKVKFNNKLKKMRRLIERDLAEGREPHLNRHCSKQDKKRFQQIYNQVKQQRKW
ncbi:uncharacterized protein LOC6046226 [Culex quinquefasciatus]|uniref:uncharacterized protein LOC6046226 n=1 Tax=Culex quinquefasciatus TaxID=7176 RepID=UPI0018E2E757|nr:uncharacterized protein LOC6046226 [Culex quinquefasciatus]